MFKKLLFFIGCYSFGKMHLNIMGHFLGMDFFQSVRFASLKMDNFLWQKMVQWFMSGNCKHVRWHSRQS